MKQIIKKQTGCDKVIKRGQKYTAIFLEEAPLEFKHFYKDGKFVSKTIDIDKQTQREIKLKELGV